MGLHGREGTNLLELPLLTAGLTPIKGAEKVTRFSPASKVFTRRDSQPRELEASEFPDHRLHGFFFSYNASAVLGAWTANKL